MREEEEEKEEELAEAAFPRPSRSSVPPPPPPPCRCSAVLLLRRTGPMSTDRAWSWRLDGPSDAEGAQAVATLRGGGCGGRPEEPLAARTSACCEALRCEDQRQR